MTDECPNCRALRERISLLEGALEKEKIKSNVGTLSEALKISPQQAEILLVLKKVHPARLGGAELLGKVRPVWMVHGMAHQRTTMLIRVQVKNIRDALGENAILTIYGAGYGLSGDMVERMEHVLQRAEAARVSYRKGVVENREGLAKTAV